MERRNSMDITAQILRIARRGAKKTHIVYKANLNHNLLKSYLDRLKREGLIASEDNARNIIKTTGRGVEFIEQYMTLQSLARF